MAHLSEVEGRPHEFSGITLWERFVDSANRHAEDIALVCVHQPSGQLSLPNTGLDDPGFRQNPYLRLKYRHLAEAVNKFANALLELGVEPGTPIFSFVPNLAEYVIAVWTTIKLGCTFVPINPRNLLNKQEVVYMIDTALSWKSSESAVVLAGDVKTAQGLDELGIKHQLTKIIISDEDRDGWINFAGLLRSAAANHHRNPSFSTAIGAASNFILFTSGTTSLPKGVRWMADSISVVLEERSLYQKQTSEDVIAVFAPNNHAIGMCMALFGFASGASIVYPGPAFDPQVVMDTIIRESCTQMSLVPTMVHALLGVKANSGGKVSSLQRINIGGTMVSPEIINKCRNELGAEHIDNLWGMTEGCTATTRSVPVHDLINGNDVAVGFASSNSRLRICASNSRDPLPRGMPGELHYSGRTLVDGYIGKQSDEFYTDGDGRRWFVTGDQAMIDEKDRIFIIGRYKEMIIRGAENIAPAAIESVLSQIPETMRFEVQVVGARDPIAGEVPVAIYKGKSDPIAAQNIQQSVLSRVGPAHVPDQVIALDDLGLIDYPRTMAGKVQKFKLAAIVQEFRDKENQSPGMNDRHIRNDISHTIKKIWKRALGYDVDENLSFASFADSITIMKTRDMIAKELGKQISLTDMIDAKNIVGQIKMLQETPHETTIRRPQQTRREGPVTANDAIALHHRPTTFDKSKIFIETILGKHNLAWNEVADVVPVYDFMSVANQHKVMDTWCFTIITMTKMKVVHDVRRVLKMVLSNWPIMTSFMVWNHDVFNSNSTNYVIMQQTDKFLDQLIHDYGVVKSVEELESIGNRYPIENAAVIPGPLFDACLIFVEATQSVAIAFRLHHAVLDASSSTLFFEDLEHALGGQTLRPHTSYKIWSDTYYSLRTSLDAQIATKFHINRLTGISSQRRALWIDSKGPRAEQDVIKVQFEIPDLLKLRQTHPDIAAAVILKAAFSLMQAHRSKHSHVVFTNHQACRDRFPFIPKALEEFGYDYSAADVAGPTIHTVFNLIEIHNQETVLDFLFRMQDDQDNLTKYASAPLDQIFNGLSDHDRSFFLEVFRTFRFNWIPGFGARDPNRFVNFSNVAVVHRPECNGISLSGGLGGSRGATMFVDLRSSVLSQQERYKIAKEIEAITRWLVDAENWGVAVGGYTEAVKSMEGDGVVIVNGSV